VVIFSYSEGTLQLPMWNLFDHELTIYNSKWLTTDDLQQVVNYIEQGKLHTAPLISVVVDFSRYPEAVEMIGRGDAVKIIMVP
jgi:threonine dehydrogenase-like Zn-dependent dehydrogenase